MIDFAPHRRFVHLPSGVVGFLGCLLAAASASAGDYIVHVWRSEDGLPQNNVISLAQTPDGYLWVGTRSAGLARFDGVRFAVFNPGNTPNLEDVEVENLSVDSSGDLWIATGVRSLSRLAGGRFHAVLPRHGTPLRHPERIVAESPTEVLFSTRSHALYRVPRQGENVRAALLDAPVPAWSSRGRALSVDADGARWYRDQEGRLVRLSGSGFDEARIYESAGDHGFVDLAATDTGRIYGAGQAYIRRFTGEGFEQVQPSNGPAPTDILRILPAGGDALWVWESTRLRKLDQDAWVLEVPLAGLSEPIAPEQIHRGSDGVLWAALRPRGLLVVQPDGAIDTLTPKHGLPTSRITCWLEDAERNVWVGTRGGGMARIRRRMIRAYGEAEGIPGSHVQSVCEDRAGRLWVGTAAGGLARLDGDRFVPQAWDPPIRQDAESVTVFPDADEGLWIGTMRGGTFRYADGQFDRVIPWSHQAARSTEVVFQDSRGQVWFGNGEALFRFADGVAGSMGPQDGFPAPVAARAIAEGPPGSLWVGIGTGDLLEWQNDRFITHQPPATWRPSRISALLADDQGGVWIGTLGGGMLRYHNGSFGRITTENGLPSDSVTQLLMGSDGQLWGGTYAGVFRASVADLTAVAKGEADRVICSAYGPLHGLPALECSGWFQPACWKSRDGTLWFSTVEGLARIDSRRVNGNQRPPPVAIEEMRVNGTLVDSAAVPAPLRLPPGRHYVEFRFTAPSLSAPHEVRFRWMLDGVDDRWRDALGRRMVGYGPLPSGDYRFQVMAANNDGVWNQQGAEVAFTVLPHFWTTLPFKIGTGLGGVGALVLVVGYVVHRRSRRLLHQLQLKRALERERTRIAQDLHDDLGTSLTHIGMMSGLASRESLSPRVEDLTLQIRETARQMVTALNEIVWALNPKNDSLTELVGYLGNFAAEFFRDTPVRCRLRIPPVLPHVSRQSDVRHSLFLAFKEALNNALRHADCDEVWIVAVIESGHMVLRIEDNGIGFTPERPGAHLGNGVRNMRERLEAADGSCRWLERAGGGTVVEFSVPLDSLPLTGRETSNRRREAVVETES